MHKNEKRGWMMVGFYLLVATLLITFGGFSVVVNEESSGNEQLPDYEEELDKLKNELEKYCRRRMVVLRREIRDEIHAYRDNTDDFIAELYSYKVKFASMGRKIEEWFSKDKKKVERYLVSIWEKTMFTQMDINNIVNRRLYEALDDLNEKASRLLDEVSAQIYEDSMKTQEEIRNLLLAELDESNAFKIIETKSLRKMLKNSSLSMGAAVGSFLAVDIAVGSAAGGTAMASGFAGGAATCGISVLAGFLVEWGLSKFNEGKAKEKIYERIEELAEDVSSEVYNSIIYY